MKLPSQAEHACTHFFPFLSFSIYPLIYPSLAFCLYTPSSSSSSSRQPRQVADRQIEAWQTGIITCGCLRATWQLYLQLSPENAFSSPAESCRPGPPARPPSSLPACPSSTMVRHGAAGWGGWGVGGYTATYTHHCQYRISLPGITINTISTKSFCASLKVKGVIKVDGSCTWSNKPKYWQLTSEPSLMLTVPDPTQPHPPPPKLSHQSGTWRWCQQQMQNVGTGVWANGGYTIWSHTWNASQLYHEERNSFLKEMKWEKLLFKDMEFGCILNYK